MASGGGRQGYSTLAWALAAARARDATAIGRPWPSSCWWRGRWPGRQCNTLVLAPGGYRFTDYPRLGAPLTLIVLIVGTGLIALVWPLQHRPYAPGSNPKRTALCVCHGIIRRARRRVKDASPGYPSLTVVILLRELLTPVISGGTHAPPSRLSMRRGAGYGRHRPPPQPGRLLLWRLPGLCALS